MRRKGREKRKHEMVRGETQEDERRENSMRGNGKDGGWGKNGRHVGMRREKDKDKILADIRQDETRQESRRDRNTVWD